MCICVQSTSVINREKVICIMNTSVVCELCLNQAVGGTPDAPSARYGCSSDAPFCSKLMLPVERVRVCV